MINQSLTVTVLKWLLLFFACLFSTDAISQCAGLDGTTTICNKDLDDSNKSFALFPLLTGNPDLGGTWSTNDPANFFALDRATGILNLWDVKNSGLHEFTYTNNTCGESAIVTISLGGYPGEDNIDGSADACGDDISVNLNGYIGSQTDGKFHDFNGLWEAVTPEAIPHLTLNFFNAEEAGPGIYEFTHTVPEVATCASRQVRLILEVQRPAKSGTGSDFTACITDDLSTFTNYNLNDLLEDEDINGTWSESNLTNQIADLTDNIIDIEAIRDAHGSGIYTFTYLVFPGHPVCTEMRTSVDIVILPKLIATMTASNYCEGSTNYIINITDYDDTLVPSGTYNIQYQISPSNPNTRDNSTLTLRNDRTGFFEIQANEITSNEVTTLTITSLGPEFCAEIEIDPITFLVTDPGASIPDSCFEEDVTVTLSNIYDSSSSKANGSYDISYTLTDPNAISSTFTQNGIPFTAGGTTFTIPSAQITEIGDYTINFEVDSGFILDCEITSDVTINAIPDAISLDLNVDNSCNATSIDVLVDAPVLSDGSYSVIYDVTQQSTNTVVINNTINFPGGNATYQLDVGDLDQGNYTVTVRSIQDDTTLCRKIFEFEETENFAVEGVPELASGDENQTFCSNEYDMTGLTLENITISSNGEIVFYDTETSTTALPIDTQLVNGEDYFAANIDVNNNCQGSQRIRISVEIIEILMPTSAILNPEFCAAENATLSELMVTPSVGNTIAWFDAITDGNLLDETTVLTDGTSYFAATESTNGCFSQNRLEIIPTVYALESASLLFESLELCGLDNPTLADLSQLENTIDYEVIWYDVLDNGTALKEETLLSSGVTYYAESFNPLTGCINPPRMAVTVLLSNCEPVTYDFFIPDAFSPNGDGRNDTYFIPNIETIYPDFTFEIINRYGSSIFKGDINNPSWNGENKNSAAPTGIYFYIIQFNKDQRPAEQGKIYLNR